MTEAEIDKQVAEQLQRMAADADTYAADSLDPAWWSANAAKLRELAARFAPRD